MDNRSVKLEAVPIPVFDSGLHCLLAVGLWQKMLSLSETHSCYLYKGYLYLRAGVKFNGINKALN